MGNVTQAIEKLSTLHETLTSMVSRRALHLPPDLNPLRSLPALSRELIELAGHTLTPSQPPPERDPLTALHERTARLLAACAKTDANWVFADPGPLLVVYYLTLALLRLTPR